jgi:type I restriction enzyme S subunit
MSALPSGWRWVTVEEVAGSARQNLVIGPFGSDLKVSDYRPTGVPLIFVRNIRSGDFSTSATRSIDETKATSLRAHEARSGDVLITKMGDPPGDARVYRGPPAIVTADCIRLRPSPDFDARFIAMAFASAPVKSQIQQITRGVAQRKVSLSRLRTGVQLPVPPLAEQRRIVGILEDHLSRVDAADRNLDAAEARLQGLRDQVIRRELFPSSRAGEPHAALVPSADADDRLLPNLAPSIRWARLEDVADVVGGITKDSSKQSDPALVEVPYLRVANVQRGRLDLSVITTIRASATKVRALRLLPGDVLLNEGGDRDKLGRGWVWEGQIDECIHQNHVFRARIRGDVLRPRLLSWAANTVGGGWCERNGKQSVNLASISLSKIRRMPVPVPPHADQAVIEERILAGLGGCSRLEQNIVRAGAESRSLRRSLLDAAFAGRLTGSEFGVDQALEVISV